jgi:hypothetical protein
MSATPAGLNGLKLTRAELTEVHERTPNDLTDKFLDALDCAIAALGV